MVLEELLPHVELLLPQELTIARTCTHVLSPSGRSSPLLGADVGVIEGFRSLGTLTGPMLGGWLFESCGYRAPFLIPTFAMLLMLAPIGVSAITNQHNSSH